MTLARDAQHVAVVDAGRDVDLDRAPLDLLPRPVARLAGLADLHALAVAGTAGRLRLDPPEQRVAHLHNHAASAAARAGAHAAARLGARAVAALAGLVALDRE